ncbi:MAG: hypothetical protein M1817_001469 [Caeruleum heppii]|nr:MAG: hypothetical protein M1817_001469 [Caeruleum heppii]
MTRGNATLRNVQVNNPQICQSPPVLSQAGSDILSPANSRPVSDVSSVDERTTVIRWQSPVAPTAPPVSPITITPPEPIHSRTLSPPPPRLSPPRTTISTPNATLSAPQFIGPIQPVSPIGPLSVQFDERLLLPESSKTSLASVPREQVSLPREHVDSGIAPPTPTTDRDDRSYIRYAIDQLTRDRNRRTLDDRRPDSTASYPVERIIPNDAFHTGSRIVSRRSSSTKSASGRNSVPAIFVPVHKPRCHVIHPKLDYLPAVIRPLSLGLLLIFCIAIIAVLIFSMLFSRSHAGLWMYDGDVGNRYFVCQFLPQLLACLFLLFLLSIQSTIIRLMPFIFMACDSAKLRSNALLLDTFQSNLLLPYAAYFRAGHPILGSCMLAFWLGLFTIPFSSSLIQVRLIEVQGRQTWRWVTVQPIAWILITLYVLLALAIFTVIILLFRRRTGLKWDPSSLADLIVLFQRSNSLADYRSSETFTSRQDFRRKLMLRSDRLGYWKIRNGASDVFHAVGEEGAPIRRYSLHHGRVHKKSQPRQLSPDSEKFDLESQQPVASSTVMSLQSKIYSPIIRYRYMPWFLRRSWLITWGACSAALLLAFLIASYVHEALERGFDPLLETTPTVQGFSSAGFLYSFLPSLFGLILFLLWQPFDSYLRALQPYANLANPQGTSAENSLLLRYPSCHPLEISLRAAVAGHWRLAWVSFMGLVSIAFPILGGGLFWAIYFPDAKEVRMITRMPALYPLTVLLVIYALSLFAVWPGRKRHMPHDVRALAEVISFFYQSRLLDDSAFRNAFTKSELSRKLVEGIPGEEEPAIYAFGVYKGRDGKEHLGIDRLHRSGSDMIVTTGIIS